MRNRNINILSVPRRSLTMRQEKLVWCLQDYLPLLAGPGHLKDLELPAKTAVEPISANPSWQTKDELK